MSYATSCKKLQSVGKLLNCLAKRKYSSINFNVLRVLNNLFLNSKILFLFQTLPIKIGTGNGEGEDVDVSSLEEGIYFVKVMDEQGNVAVGKFVKE